MFPSPRQIIVMHRHFSSFHATDFSTNISGSIDRRCGAAAGTRKQLSIVDRQARESTPLVVFLSRRMTGQAGLPTLGRIESLQRSPLRLAIEAADFRAWNRTAVKLAVV